MIQVLYFAGLQEQIGHAAESLALPTTVTTLGQLREHLIALGAGRECLANARNLKVARNQEMAVLSDRCQDGDEIAFFPPVTGG